MRVQLPSAVKATSKGINMFKLICKLPRKIYLAYSGGVDSRVALHFLSKNHEITLLHVNTGDTASSLEVPEVKSVAGMYNLKYELHDRISEVPAGISKEHYWSCMRKDVFFRKKEPVVLCHHLDDVIETWVVSSLQGKPTLMRTQTENIVRPFLLNSKQKFLAYAERHELKWIEDETNSDPEFSQRNFVRNVMMKDVKIVNPGIEKTVVKLLLDRHNKERQAM
jgi:tRNA(Ile)-lysidine synthase TilS/MesJ